MHMETKRVHGTLFHLLLAVEMGKQFPQKPVQTHCRHCQEHLGQKQRDCPLRFFTFPVKSTRVLFKEIELSGRCKTTVICGIKPMTNTANVENAGSINNPPGCICIFKYICICIYVYVYLNIYVYMYIFIYVYMYICMYICIYVYIYICICMCVYMYIYMYMYLKCIYIYIYVNIQFHPSFGQSKQHPAEGSLRASSDRRANEVLDGQVVRW